MTPTSTERDWTLTDQAAAADDKAHREWWRADPLAEDRDRGPPYAEEDE